MQNMMEICMYISICAKCVGTGFWSSRGKHTPASHIIIRLKHQCLWVLTHYFPLFLYGFVTNNIKYSTVVPKSSNDNMCREISAICKGHKYFTLLIHCHTHQLFFTFPSNETKCLFVKNKTSVNV